MTQTSPNLPSVITSLAGIPAALVPSSLKAIDRLIGAATDIPAAWLSQQKAKIDSQTQAYTLVESQIAKLAAEEAGTNPAIVERAVEILVRKSYQKYINRESVAKAAMDELSSQKEKVSPTQEEESQNGSQAENTIDDDWLNVFEKYAEDATSDRMQALWGRVLAGEIRKPGNFSMRTLRFLSEFSQKEALIFERMSQNIFGGMGPANLIKKSDDIKEIIELESCGLITGGTGLGLQHSINISQSGFGFISEMDTAIIFKGKAGDKIKTEAVALTPLGKELITLIPSRDKRLAARNVALAMKSQAIEEAFITAVEDGIAVGEPDYLWSAKS